MELDEEIEESLTTMSLQDRAIDQKEKIPSPAIALAVTLLMAFPVCADEFQVNELNSAPLAFLFYDRWCASSPATRSTSSHPIEG